MSPSRLILMGVSSGAIEALRILLPALPASLPVALVLVIHRHRVESGDLIPLLTRICRLPVRFPEDKEVIRPGCLYIAPPDYHLLIEADHFAFSLEELVNHARPSIDVLFESAADACGPQTIGIILTGMGCDGAQGLAAIRRRGGMAMVQNPDAADADQMPLAALAAVPDARQMTLEEMGTWLAGIAVAGITEG